MTPDCELLLQLPLPTRRVAQQSRRAKEPGRAGLRSVPECPARSTATPTLQASSDSCKILSLFIFPYYMSYILLHVCFLWLHELKAVLPQVFCLVLNQVFRGTSPSCVLLFCCFHKLIENRINFLVCFLSEANEIHHLHHKLIQYS